MHHVLMLKLPSENTLLVEMRDESGIVVSQSRRIVKSEITTLAPFALIPSTPAANTEHHAPDTPITLQFNRDDVSWENVSVEVSQSVLGKAYELTGQQGAEFTAISVLERIDVNLNRAVVAGDPGVKNVDMYACSTELLLNHFSLLQLRLATSSRH